MIGYHHGHIHQQRARHGASESRPKKRRCVCGPASQPGEFCPGKSHSVSTSKWLDVGGGMNWNVDRSPIREISATCIIATRRLVTHQRPGTPYSVPKPSRRLISLRGFWLALVNGPTLLFWLTVPSFVQSVRTASDPNMCLISQGCL